VLLMSYGSRGDVEPLAGLAVRLREQGAEVRVCAPPDFADLMAGVGVTLTPMGWPIQALATGTIPGKEKAGLPQIAGELTAMAYETIMKAAEGCAAVLATGSLPAVLGAQAATEKLGVPYRFATFSPSTVPTPNRRPLPWPGQVLPEGETDNLKLWKAQAGHLQTMLGETINTHRKSVGLPPLDSVREHAFTHRPILAADPVLGPWQRTPDLDVVQTGAWFRQDDRPLPADLTEFLAAGAEPVYVGFGSMLIRGAEPAEVARAVVAAVRAQGRRVILSSGWATLAKIDDQDDCFAIGEVNQQKLFGQVAAVVHHGGAGTTATAARAGAPQVLVPQVADQPYWAGRVAELGIGVAHEGSIPTTNTLATALEAVLTDQTRTRAAEMARTTNTDGAKAAAKLLLAEQPAK
jgi:vancomycin aglycone glucosyltransferase